MKFLGYKDIEIFKIIKKEQKRQIENLELIASENYVSKEILKAQGSILTNKYAEGYPNKRYYGGCFYVDEAEMLAIERVKELFGCQFANVQAHSGSGANMAAYRAILKPNDRILGMALDHGGHLTHGHKMSFSGSDYEVFSYGVDPESHLIDYEKLEELALSLKPKMIIVGASCYARAIDFKKFGEIAKKAGSYLVADVAHIAGLIAAGLHDSPFPYADIVTSTTHKTLRGPRGGLILTNNPEIAAEINKVVFPGIQGGPLMHTIAAKAVCFYEALQPEFKEYQKNVIANARILANEFIKLGYSVVSNGTDTHLLSVDVKKSLGMTGKLAEKILDEVNITVNKNTVPNDPEKPFVTSGIRIGTPALTTRGLAEADFVKVAHFIDRALKNYKDENYLKALKQEVKRFAKEFKIFN
ncbi:MAG: serine hydroxymethyltransferase [Erysipelotrichales bacterium]|nr:serine hydroxymethyltransferase [Erysipelotrichales bacterium]